AQRCTARPRAPTSARSFAPRRGRAGTDGAFSSPRHNRRCDPRLPGLDGHPQGQLRRPSLRRAARIRKRHLPARSSVMGTARWDPSAWSAYASTAAATPRAARFKSRGLVRELDPMGVSVRESRDSTVNPLSTAIIVGLDVTGSMGRIADAMSKDGLGTLFTEILDRPPVSDPHLMFMGIGDVMCD